VHARIPTRVQLQKDRRLPDDGATASPHEADAPPGNVPVYERCVSAMGWRRGHMLDDDDLTFIGECDESNGISIETRPFGMRRADRRSHFLSLGKTG
jgi:hypothetical protein